MIPFIEFLVSLSLILTLGISGFLVNVLLHELGHAIPILIWSEKKVIVFIGSFGARSRSLRLPFGRLELFIKYNPLLWMRGMCQPGEHLSVKKTIFYTAMGPLVSLAIAVSCFVLLKNIDFGAGQMVILVTIMTIGGMCTLGSAIPRNRLFVTHDGMPMGNDASQIVRLWKMRGLPDAYWEVWKKICNKEYDAASDLAEKTIDEGYSNAALLRLAIVAHMRTGRYERTGTLLELIRANHRFILEDEVNDGCHKILVGRFGEATYIYSKLLRTHFNHFIILNNMGYSLVADGKPEKALSYLDRGIMLAPRFADLYANRAWAKMMQGKWEEGMADARRALELDDTNVDGYRVSGLYALEKGRAQEAKDLLLKAWSLDRHALFIDEPLAEADRRLRIEANSRL